MRVSFIILSAITIQLFLGACSSVKPRSAAADSLILQNNFHQHRFKASNGFEIPYRMLLPEDYNANKKYPVVLFLHGGGERGNDNWKQLTHGAALFAEKKNRRKYPCIALFPQCPAEGYWASAKIDRSVKPINITFDYTKSPTIWLEAALEVLDKTLNEERSDSSRVYIVGLSMGGMGTFEAVHHNTSRFAAAIPICGGGDTVRYTSSASTIPFRIYHGALDDVVSVKQSRGMVKKLNELGARVDYKEYPNVKHNSWENAFDEPDFLEWMFSQRK
jgi:predicted peptidase